MAEQVHITGSDAEAKIRNPLAPALLPYVTFGIYFLVWYYRINKELAAMGRARNTQELGESPVTSLMAVLFGWIIIVPPFISLYKTWNRTVTAGQLVGVQTMEAGLGFLLTILLAPIGHYLLQRDLNNVLTAQASGSGAALGAGGAGIPGVTSPPQQPPLSETPPPPATGS